ncbi:MAG: malate dehydrogenase [Candidatus Omnitrophota bacterium]
MQKVAIIGAGNVGSLAAMRIIEEGIADVVLVDVVKGIASGKSLDLEDARSTVKHNSKIFGTENIDDIKGSDLVVITAGLARKPGMTREELLLKNGTILEEISLKIKQLCPKTLVIVVTNPLDLMTYLVMKVTGFVRERVFGMGPSLDASRFSNLISQELNVPACEIEALVIGAHGETMVPLGRFSYVGGVSLDKMLPKEKIAQLYELTVKRGAQIVNLLGSGSAYFAPSASLSNLVKIIFKDEKKNIGICTYLNDEYGLSDICIGVPARLGKNGIEKIIELELSKEELSSLHKSADSIKEQIRVLKESFKI